MPGIPLALTSPMPISGVISHKLVSGELQGPLRRFADYTVMWSPGRQLHDIGDGEDLSDFDE